MAKKLVELHELLVRSSCPITSLSGSMALSFCHSIVNDYSN